MSRSAWRAPVDALQITSHVYQYRERLRHEPEPVQSAVALKKLHRVRHSRLDLLEGPLEIGVFVRLVSFVGFLLDQDIAEEFVIEPARLLLRARHGYTSRVRSA